MTDGTIGYGVFRCLSNNCGQPGQSYWLTGNGVNYYVVIANTAVGETHTLFMQWDGNIFSFQVDGNTPVTYDPKVLAPVVSSTPNSPVIWAGIRHKEADGQSGSVTATFDNVRAGAALAITTFATADISGYWEGTGTEVVGSGNTHSFQLSFTQNGTAISGSFICGSNPTASAISGSMNGNNLNLSMTDSACGISGCSTVLTAAISGASLSGAWSATDGTSGTWSASRLSSNPCP